MNLTLRLAEEGDLHALQQLAAQTFPDAAPDYIPQEAVAEFIATNLSLESFQHYLRSPHYLVTVAQAEEGLVGYTLLDISGQEQPEGLTQAAYLSKFYLSAQARGSGAAMDLMDRVFQDAAQEGFTSIWLGTAKANSRANAFYAKAGFRVIGERQFEVAPGIFGEDYLRAVQL